MGLKYSVPLFQYFYTNELVSLIFGPHYFQHFCFTLPLRPLYKQSWDSNNALIRLRVEANIHLSFIIFNEYLRRTNYVLGTLQSSSVEGTEGMHCTALLQVLLASRGGG